MNNKGIYFDGISEQSCELVLQANHIYMYLNNENKDLFVWHLKSTQAQHVGLSLKLTKNNSNEYIICEQNLASAVYQRWQNPLPEAQNTHKPGKRVLAFFLAFVAGIIALCLTAYFLALPWMAEKAVTFIPESLEIEMGENLSEQYVQESENNDSLNYDVNDFLQQLKITSKYPLQAQVLNSNEMNAFAIPGGHIFIYSGLLKKLNSYQELSALLGHEATHVIHRHSLKSVFRSAAGSMVIAAIFGNSSEIMPWLVSQANNFKQLDYSRDLESEADDNGVNILIENKINPQGMLDLLQLLKSENKEEPALMKYLGTHPDTETRIEQVSKRTDIKTVFPENEKLKNLFEKMKREIDP